MDTVTHALIGAVTARACTKTNDEKSREYSLLFVAALAAAFPDIDYLWFWVNPYLFITDWHRGITHSLVLLPAWATLLSTAVFFVMKRQIPFRTVLGYSSVGLLTHIIADIITLYGLKLFSPLSDQRFALSLVFDLDPWIGMISLLSLAFGLKNQTYSAFGLIAIGSYITLLFFFQQNALGVIEDRTGTRKINTDKIYALPQPFIPFHWKLVIDREDYYETANLSLFKTGTGLIDEILSYSNFIMPLVSADMQCNRDYMHCNKTNNHFKTIEIIDFRPEAQLEWQTISKHGDTQEENDLALEVWQHDSFTKYRKFSSVPVLYRIDTEPRSTCIWYTDLRYIFPLIKPPFRYGLCRQHSKNNWQLYRLRRNTENIRQLIG